MLDDIDFEGDGESLDPATSGLDQEAPVEDSQAASGDNGDGKPEPTPEESDAAESKGADGAPPAPEEKRVMVPLSELLDERSKRQTAQQELEQLRGQQQKPTGPTEDEIRDAFIDNPGAVLKGLKEDFSKQVDARLEQERLKWSLNAAKERHQDFDDALRSWDDAVRENPALDQKMLASSDPAEFAYRHGKLFGQVKDIGDIDQWKTKERKRIEADVRREIEQRETDEAKERVIRTNAGTRYSGVNGSAAQHEDIDSVDAYFDN